MLNICEQHFDLRS